MLIGSPVGTPEERATGLVWPGRWFDFTPFGIRYVLRVDAAGNEVWARHTGADLNLPGNADAGAPIYAIADGRVITSRFCGTSWGWLIVIEHKDDDGNPFYSRYAHVNHIQFPVVGENQPVTFGSTIALVGNADGTYGFGHHLHFDISHTQVLKTNPGHWPGDVDEAIVRSNYSDPRRFIIEKHTQPAVTDLGQLETMKVIATSLRIRPQPDLSLPEIGWLKYGDIVQVAGNIPGNGYHFAAVSSVNGAAFTSGNGSGGYTAREHLTAVL